MDHYDYSLQCPVSWTLVSMFFYFLTDFKYSQIKRQTFSSNPAMGNIISEITKTEYGRLYVYKYIRK